MQVKPPSNCLEKYPKLMYHNSTALLQSIPETYSSLHALCSEKFPSLLPDFAVFGISATGRRQLCEENFRDVMNGPARVKTFEVFDQSESDGVYIRPFCLIGFQCLHDSAFMMQSYSLEDFKLHCRRITASRGFSYVVTSDSLVVSGGMNQFQHKVSRYRNGFMESLPDMMNPHSFHLSLSDGSRLLYVVGGKDKKDNPACKCEVYDFETGRWAPLPNLPRKVMTVTGCLLGSTVFVLIAGVVHRLDAKAWTEVVTLDPRYGEFSAVQASSADILIYGSRRDCPTIVVNPETQAIDPVPAVPASGKLHYFKPARHRGRVYMYAGHVNTVITYNVSERRWHYVSEEYWEMRKGLLLVCSEGRKGTVAWQGWKLPPSLIREIAGEYIGAASRSPFSNPIN